MSNLQRRQFACTLILLAIFCFLPIAAGAQAHSVVCSGGFGSFDAKSTTGVAVSVGPERSGEFAKHACQAKFRWERQDLRAVPDASEVDVDAMGIDLGLGSLVVALQVKATDSDPLMKYEIYSLKKPPRLLKEITGGDYYSAADTDLDGLIEIWTDDAGALKDFDNIPLSSFDLPPTVVLRYEKERLIDVSSEFRSAFDRQIEALRTQIDPRDLADFKTSDGKLSTMFHMSADQMHRDLTTKIRVLEIVWGYLYSDREQDAWNALGAMWPPADVDRIRASILDARAHGIRSRVDGVSHELAPSRRPKHAMIFDRVTGKVSDATVDLPHQGHGDPSMGSGGSGGSQDHMSSFEADSFPVQILMRRPPPPEGSEAAPVTEVAVNLVVDAAGKVRSAKVEGSPDKDLVGSTVGWKFIPAYKDGKAVASRLRMGVTPSQ
jgi:hypothetical protein